MSDWFAKILDARKGIDDAMREACGRAVKAMNREREPGFYWVRHANSADWEPAAWNGDHWAFLGTELADGEAFGEPHEVGIKVAEPKSYRQRACRQCGALEGERHRFRHIAQYE